MCLLTLVLSRCWYLGFRSLYVAERKTRARARTRVHQDIVSRERTMRIRSALTLSEGLRRCAGVARFYLRHSSAKGVRDGRGGRFYVATRFLYFLRSCCAAGTRVCVRARVCKRGTYMCAHRAHNSDSAPSHGLLNKPRKS